MELKLIDYTDSVLHEETRKFDFDDPEYDPMELTESLIEICYNSGGFAIAANQVGIDLSVLVILTDDPIAMFNPKIVDYSEETIVLDEGCLSYPGLIVKVKRPRHIRVRYAGPDGVIVTEKYTGMTARAIQHEIDHLEGLTMLDVCSIVQKEKAVKKLRRRK